MKRKSKTASLRKKEEKQVLWTFSTQRYRGTEKNGLFFTGRDSSSGGFAARLRRFFPKGLKNPPALIIGIYNVDNNHILYSVSESYRIKNPDIKRGRITNPTERPNDRTLLLAKRHHGVRKKGEKEVWLKRLVVRR